MISLCSSSRVCLDNVALSLLFLLTFDQHVICAAGVSAFMCGEGLHLQVVSRILLRWAGKIKCEDLKGVTEDSEMLRIKGIHMRSMHLYSSRGFGRVRIFVWQ